MIESIQKFIGDQLKKDGENEDSTLKSMCMLQ